MPAASIPPQRASAWRSRDFSWAAVTLLLGASLVQAAEAGGVVVSIPPANILEAAGRLPTLLELPLKELHAERARGQVRDFYLICDFNPNGQPSSSDSFGACYELAKRLRQLQDEHSLSAIAYVHGEVSRHSVLPVLACDQIVMAQAPSVSLGKVVDQGARLDELERLPYEQMSRNRYPVALVRKMYDPRTEVVEVKSAMGGGERFLDGRDEARREGRPVPGLAAGVTVAYSFELAQRVGLVQPEPRNSLEEVLQAYRLPRSALHQTPQKLIVCQTTLSGPISGEMKEILERRLRRVDQLQANVLVLRLECAGGESDKAHEIALLLAELGERPERRVETVAYLLPQARDLASFLALACDRIYMHPDAYLGDFEPYLRENESREEIIRRNLMELAKSKHYPEVLAEGMLSRSLRIRWVQSEVGRSEKRFMSDAEYDEASKEGKWRTLETIKPATEDDVDRYLTLPAETAQRLGLAQGVVREEGEIYQSLGVKPDEVEVVDSDFLERVALFLRDPWTSLVLIVMGITCLILELKMPGVGVPGIIAAVCFVLYFWSHSQLHGEMTWLALFLFLLGMVLLALEIFVVPGFGVTGVSGILLVLGSLGLMAIGHWPRSEDDWVAFGSRMAALALGMMGAIFLAIALFRYLPSIPYANRLMLRPEETEAGDADGEEMEEMLQLLGAIGVAATPLRPAGKAQLGEEFLDVVAEGGFIPAGARVQIIEIEGRRVVVKEV